jgi:cytochrome c peroxidase
MVLSALAGAIPAGASAQVAAAPSGRGLAASTASAGAPAAACLGCHSSAAGDAAALPAAQPVPPAPLDAFPSRPLDALKYALRPRPDLLAYVADQVALTQLGKALFWDVQVGSDGQTACATCHFQAGADGRTKNQLNPGGGGTGDTTFQVGTGPNYTVMAKDYPFTRHADENDPSSPRGTDVNDITGSQGVLNGTFQSITTSPFDKCKYIVDPVFHFGRVGARQVTGRNTPPAINAVFNYRNFWDGRANNDFNGVNPFGQRDPNAMVWYAPNSTTLTRVQIVIPNSSLASQSVGPPGSSVEMACMGRSFAELGKKLTTSTLPPLGLQMVHKDDSVLGALSRSRLSSLLKGINTTYPALIKKAFKPEWWNGPPVMVNGAQFTMMQANFSLFWGLALQSYESTLVSDDSPADRYFLGNMSALSDSAQRGLLVFEGRAHCVNCHSGPETTNASYGNVVSEHLEQMTMSDGGCRIYDNGFYNIGVRPTGDDPGVGGNDPFGNPLSETQMYLDGKLPQVGPPIVSLDCVDWSDQANVMGSFKTPSLRNVELTGPYFHNGGKATLMQVVNFYNRGGDFGDTNIANLAPDIMKLGLSAQEKQDLVAFLVSLTDERVRYQRAPFDHPALCVPNGSFKAGIGLQICLPAVGKAGDTKPLKPFLSLDPFQDYTTR